MEHAPSTNLSGTPREQPRLRSITGEGTFSKPRSSDHEHPSGVHKIAQKETIKTDDLKTLDEQNASPETTSNDLARPQREAIPRLYPYRQELRAEARAEAKKARKDAKKSLVKESTTSNTASPFVKGKYASFLSTDLQQMMGRMEQIETQVADLHKGHTELIDGHRAMEEKLLAELEYIREGLTLKDTPKPAPKNIPTARQEATTVAPIEEGVNSPGLELTDLAALDEEEADRAPSIEWGEEEIDVPDTTAKKKRSKISELKAIKRGPEGEALLSSLADKYGILVSNEARAAHHEELIGTFRAQDQELRSLKRQLKEDKEAANTHGNTTSEKRKGLQGKIRETEKRVAQLSKTQAATNEELDTYATYPTAAEEISFNLEELIEEMDKTNPNNKIRLQQLKNNFADLERMQVLVQAQETSRAKAETKINGPSKPWGWGFGKPLTALRDNSLFQESSHTLPLDEIMEQGQSYLEAQKLADELDIIISPEEREAHLSTIQQSIKDIGEKLAEAEDRVAILEKEEDEGVTTDARMRTHKRLKVVQDNRDSLRRIYDEAGDEYSAALVFPTAEDEIKNRIQELEQRPQTSPEDKRNIESTKAKLERLLKTLYPTQEQTNESTQDAEIDIGTSETLEQGDFEESRLDRDQLVDEFGDDDEARHRAMHAYVTPKEQPIPPPLPRKGEIPKTASDNFGVIETELPDNNTYRLPSLADETPQTLKARIAYLKEKIVKTAQRARSEADQEGRETAKMEITRLKKYQTLLEKHLGTISQGEKSPAATPETEESEDEFKQIDDRAFLAKHRIQNLEELTRGVADQLNKTDRFKKLDKGDAAIKRPNRNRRDDLTTPLDEKPLAEDEQRMLNRVREGAATTDEDEKLIIKAEAKRFIEEKERARNVAVYQKRAEGYQTELKAIADKLAERGEFVEVPGQVALAYEAPKKSFLGSLWTNITEATTRRDVAALKKQYEAAMDRYEEAIQLKNAAGKDLPNFKKINITSQQSGIGEGADGVEKRQKEQLAFEEKLRALEKTERMARDLQTLIITHSAPPHHKEMGQADLEFAMRRFERSTAEYKNGSTEFNESTMERRNAIPYMRLINMMNEEKLKNTFSVDPNTEEEFIKTTRAIDRRITILEAKKEVASTKGERVDAQKRLDELHKLIGGKTSQDIAQRARLIYEAADRLSVVKMDNKDLQHELIDEYTKRVQKLNEILDLSGEAQAFTRSIEEELKAAK